MYKYNTRWILFRGLFVLMWITSCSPYLIKGHDYELIEVNQEIQPDPEYLTLIAPYREQLNAEMNKVIARAAKELTKNKGESTLGNLVADYQHEFAEKEFGMEIDISLMNNGGLRNSLPAGDITVGHIFELSPFENYLYVLELGPGDIRQLVDYAVKYQNLGIAGLTFEVEAQKPAKILIQGQDLLESARYKMVINDYLANGGDFMEFLIDVPRVITSEITLRDMLMEKIREYGDQGIIIDAQIEGRQIFN